ncbi:FecR family protein [Azospirillum rugosum]|uniref:FecR protein domain-containing protein n=1 Tax=Azospirillum rugosum TaxID=416170 RepID=A0ABS4SVH9_9PROT|nr:FecR family protein [Azospirillum rugosum]MBP2296578.1 hypothetical protein [Azospirillum rugosum]MDQ0530022.1 hypothetical protein [Azospirillum rugosum]
MPCRSCAAVLCGFLITLADPALAAGPVGEIQTVVGTAELVRAGTVTPMRPGLPVEAGDELRTGPAGRLRVKFRDGSAATLGSNAAMTVERFEEPGGAGTRDAALAIAGGLVRAVAEKLVGASRFEVRTPTAVAAARSTEWIVEVTRDGTAVLGVSGTVSVRSTGPGAGGPVELKAGEGTDVAPGAAPQPPKTWAAPRATRVLDATTLP